MKPLTTNEKRILRHFARSGGQHYWDHLHEQLGMSTVGLNDAIGSLSTKKLVKVFQDYAARRTTVTTTPKGWQIASDLRHKRPRKAGASEKGKTRPKKVPSGQSVSGDDASPHPTHHEVVGPADQSYDRIPGRRPTRSKGSSG